MDMKDFISPELNKPWPAHTEESIADITRRQMPKIEKIQGLPQPAADFDYYSKGFIDGLAASEKKTKVYCTEGMCRFLKKGICTKEEIHIVHDECQSFKVEDKERQQK